MDLSTLVAPLDAATFLRDHWPAHPFHVAHGDERIAALEAVDELGDVERIMATSKRVNFFAPDGAVVQAEHPMKLYALGLTCYMSGSHVPGLMAIAEGLAGDLGLPSGSLNCEIFCSAGTSGVRMHSDRDLNFAVLVRGTKRWQIAENRHIRNQTSLCRPSTAEPFDPRQLELADVVPFPTAMPDDAREIVMRSGGVLFLPRGWWHQTEAEGECLQVNFVMNRYLWVDVLTTALRERLLREPRWRGMVFDLFGEPAKREVALAEFADLLADLTGELGGIDPSLLAEELIKTSGLHAASSRHHT